MKRPEFDDRRLNLAFMRTMLQSQKQIITKLNKIIKLQGELMAKADEILAATEAETTVISSVVTLLEQLSQAVRDAGTDPVKLDAVLAKINSNKQALADAVVANTPASEQPA